MDKNGDGVVTKEVNIKQDFKAQIYYNICFECKLNIMLKNIETDDDIDEIWIKYFV